MIGSLRMFFHNTFSLTSSDDLSRFPSQYNDIDIHPTSLVFPVIV